jgi:hypothetical protein
MKSAEMYGISTGETKLLLKAIIRRRSGIRNHRTIANSKLVLSNYREDTQISRISLNIGVAGLVEIKIITLEVW